MSAIAVLVEAPEWRKEGTEFLPALRRAARLAMAQDTKGRVGAMSILLTEDTKLAALNRQFRAKSGPTNVLSFPSTDPGYLGDVAIAHGVTAREARESGKTIHDHTLHLAVHGVLHLLGYDHETARDARIMEPLEAAILARLGIADPYAARTALAR